MPSKLDIDIAIEVMGWSISHEEPPPPDDSTWGEPKIVYKDSEGNIKSEEEIPNYSTSGDYKIGDLLSKKIAECGYALLSCITRPSGATQLCMWKDDDYYSREHPSLLESVCKAALYARRACPAGGQEGELDVPSNEGREVWIPEAKEENDS